MLKHLIIITGLLFAVGLHGQYISSVTYPDSTRGINTDMNLAEVQLASQITVEKLREKLTILAADEFEGRETGQPGIDKAAEYIKSRLNKAAFVKNPNLRDGFYQDVRFNFESWNESSLYINNKRFKHLWDFLAFKATNQDVDSIEIDQVYFLGYGIDDPKYTDYRKNMKGKTIMIYEGEPKDENGNSRITGTQELSEWSSKVEKKLAVAQKHGVKCVLIISNNISKMLGKNRRAILGSSVTLGNLADRPVYPTNIYISTNIAKEIMGTRTAKVIKSRDRITKRGKSCRVKMKPRIKLTLDKKTSSLQGQNILAFIEGTDKKDEIVVLSAHYDHLGKRGESIYNGADDNGSGTSAVLEVAETFMQGVKNNIRPRRSILFMFLTGEEKGLLGSEYYVKKPIYPLENTMVDINVDMVGRVDKKYSENPNYIYVIGSDRLSTDLHKINEEANQEFTQLVLDYTYNSEQDPNRYYYRSDHYNFAKNGIPAIFFFNGTHDDYHQASDTVEKIHFEKMTKITQHVFHLAYRLANQEAAIRVDGKVKK